MIDYHADPYFWQRFLKCAGYYKADIDGDFGKISSKAAADFERDSVALGNTMQSFDGRSEGNIQTLLPAAQKKAREFMKAAADAGFTIKIISGTRTYAEQDALYRQGRSTPGNIVTHAKGGQSNHNFGVAWDIGLFKNGAYLPESPIYAKIGALGKTLGLEWGGDWKNMADEPHFQVVPEKNLAAIATKFQTGTAFV